MKKTNLIDVATSRSLKSQVDLFSKFEVNFLEKYMRCILIDQFSNLIINIYEEYFYKKLSQKISKTMGTSIFQFKSSFSLIQLLKGITNFFREKSPSVSSGQFSDPVKLVHSSQGSEIITFKERQLAFIDVKIRVEVGKIEQIPCGIQKLFQKYADETLKSYDKKFQQKLLNYKGQYLNLLIFYYGDIHFNFNRPEYKIRTIFIGKKEFKVRIFVIYVSKIAMFETFRTTNKVKVECINDLVISFYDIKREKKLLARHKKKDNQNNRNTNQELSDIGASSPKSLDYKLLLGAGGAICVGLLLMRMFS